MFVCLHVYPGWNNSQLGCYVTEQWTQSSGCTPKYMYNQALWRNSIGFISTQTNFRILVGLGGPFMDDWADLVLLFIATSGRHWSRDHSVPKWVTVKTRPSALPSMVYQYSYSLDCTAKLRYNVNLAISGECFQLLQCIKFLLVLNDITLWAEIMHKIVVFIMLCPAVEMCCPVHEFHETCHSVNFISCKKTPNDAATPQCQSQFTPKMKANVKWRLLSSLVWIF